MNTSTLDPQDDPGREAHSRAKRSSNGADRQWATHGYTPCPDNRTGGVRLATVRYALSRGWHTVAGNLPGGGVAG